MLVCGSWSRGGWLQAATGAGRLCSWLQLKWTVLLDLVRELSVELGAVFVFCTDFQRVSDNHGNLK